MTAPMRMTVQRALATLLVNAAAAAQWNDDPEEFARQYGLASPDLVRLRMASVSGVDVTRHTINRKRMAMVWGFLPVTFSVLEFRGLLRGVTEAFLATVAPLRDPLDERRHAVKARALRDFLVNGSATKVPEFIVQLCAFEYMCSDLVSQAAVRAVGSAIAPAVGTTDTYITLAEGVNVIRSNWDFAPVLMKRQEIAADDPPTSITCYVLHAQGGRIRPFRMPEAAWQVLAQCRNTVSRVGLGALVALPPGEIDTVIGKSLARGFLAVRPAPAAPEPGHPRQEKLTSG
jgi:hypothetical protein